MIFLINSINNSTATSSHNATAPNGVLDISNLQLLILLLSLVLVIFISHLLSLHIDKHLAIAATRCFLQLGALGFILVPILFFNNAPLVVVYIIFMMFVAAVEAASRPPYFFDSLLIVCFLSIFLTVSIFGIFTFFLVLRTGLDAQYAIPIVGMITGSAMSAVSVSVSNIVTNFAERKEEVEIFLALGATRWEAALQVIRSSVILGLTPTLNQMSVTGLVSIPGMFSFSAFHQQ